MEYLGGASIENRRSVVGKNPAETCYVLRWWRSRFSAGRTSGDSIDKLLQPLITHINEDVKPFFSFPLQFPHLRRDQRAGRAAGVFLGTGKVL
jgi:hypothetical protein